MAFDAGAIEARLILNRQQFQADLAAARSEGMSFENNEYQAKLGLDTSIAQARLAQMQAGLDVFQADVNAPNKLNLDTSVADTKLVGTDALYDQLRRNLEQSLVINPTVSTGAINSLQSLMNWQPGDSTQTVNLAVSGAGQADQQLTDFATETDKAGRSADNLDNSLGNLGNGFRSFLDWQRQSTQQANQQGGAFGLLTREVTLWGGALGKIPSVGVVPLWHIALDAVFESLIAVAAASAALTVGLIAMEPAAHDIYTQMLSIHDTSKALDQTIPPLTGHLHELQQAVAPGTLEIFGGALNLVNKQGSTFSTVAQQVVGGFDTWIAKLDIWANSQSHMGGILESGVGFLHQFMQIIDNVGLAFSNLIKADPGTAHFLGDVLVGASQLLDVITKLPTPILYSVLALHSFMLWGGLAASGITNLATAMFGGVQATARLAAGLGLFGDAGRAALVPLEDLRSKAGQLGSETSKTGGILGAMGALPLWGWAIVGAAAIGGLVWWMTQADSATHSFISSLDTGLGQLNASQAILAINTDIKSLDEQITQVPVHLAQANQAFANSTNQLGHGVGLVVSSFKDIGDVTQWGSGLSQWFHGLTEAAAGFWNSTVKAFGATKLQLGQGSDVQAYTGEIIKLSGEQDRLFHETGNLISQGFTYSQSLALMDLANVKAGDSYGVMKQKVDNLITGYSAMSIQGGILASAVDAVTFAAEQQQSQITAITGGWDAFMKTVSGGDSAFIKYEQSIAKVGTSAGVAGSSITGLNSQSLTLRSDWQSSLSSAGALYDALANQASAAGLGAKGTNMLSQAGKDLVAQLIPMAKGSKENTAQLYAFAQLAGYRGPDSLKSLTGWLGNTKNAAKNLDDITTTLTVDSSNLTQDMKNLANALNNNLNSAMAAAIFQAGGGQKAFDNFATVMKNTPHNITAVQNSAKGLARELLTTLGNTDQAKNEFIVFAEKLNLSHDDAERLWNSIVKGAQTMNQTHGARASLNADIQGILSRAPSAKNDMNILAAAVQKHGATAITYGPARAQLITDLEKSGVKAQTATGLVDDYIKKLQHIPPNENTNIGLTGKGTWSVQQQQVFAAGSSNLPSPLKRALGGVIPGYGGGDIVPLLAEPGETVVSKETSQVLAPVFAAAGVPGYAAGGVVGQFGGSVPGLGNWTLNEYSLSVKAMIQSVEDAIKGGVQTAQEAAANSAYLGNSGATTHSAQVAQAYAASILNQYGWPQSQMQYLIPLWNQESGWNPYAVNPSSGAYGIPQALGKGHPYDLGDYINQIIWGENYVRDRYGSPQAAWGHEVAFNWYDDGGTVPPGITMVNNSTKKNEMMLDPQMSEAFVKAINSGSLTQGGAPLIGQYHSNYYGSGDTADALNEMLFTLRRVQLESTHG